MYTFHTRYGIGEVKSIENEIVTIFYEDADLTKKTPLGFVKIYENEDDLEKAMNPILSDEELEEILVADRNSHSDRMKNQEEIRLMNLQTSRNCAKSL